MTRVATKPRHRSFHYLALIRHPEMKELGARRINCFAVSHDIATKYLAHTHMWDVIHAELSTSCTRRNLF